jgi:hypothetical protein
MTKVTISRACVCGNNEDNAMLHSEQIGEPLVRTQLYLSVEQRDVLKAEARQKNISMAEQIRRVLDRYVRRSAKK